MQELGITRNLSMAFHLQTDRLTEHTNQWVEQYLRLLAANQEEWSSWLPVATAVHNNRINATTKMSPHQLLTGINPPLSPDRINTASNPLVQEQVNMLQRHREMAAEAINKKSVTPMARWSEGQQVWLEAKNISLTYGSSKLAPRRHGPFKIVHVVSPVAYELELPKHWKIHLVFHASLLTPYIETTVHGSNFL